MLAIRINEYIQYFYRSDIIEGTILTFCFYVLSSNIQLTFPLFVVFFVPIYHLMILVDYL